jgi:hypothetical protein
MLAQRLSELLERYVANGGSMDELAQTWSERVNGLSPVVEEPIGMDTARAHLSRLRGPSLEVHSEAVLFFFAVSGRGELLLSLLGASSFEVRSIKRLVARFAGERAAPRIIIDLSPWSEHDAGELISEIDGLLALRGSGLAPVWLLFSPHQYDQLPLYARERDPDRICVPTTLAERQSIAARHEGALVISSALPAPLQRWIALEYRRGTFCIEPPEGLSDFLARGNLSTASEPVHPVGAILSPDALPSKQGLLRMKPRMRRRMLLLLGEEDSEVSQNYTANARNEAAAAYGVVATSTALERQLFSMRSHWPASLPEHPCTQEGWMLSPKSIAESYLCPEAEKNRLMLKARRLSQPVQMLFTDRLELWNASEEVHAAAALAGIAVRQIQPVPCVFERIRKELSGWTYDDLLEDCCLDDLISQMCSEPSEEEELWLAAALLWRSGGLPRWQPSPISNWQKTLRTLLEGNPPSPRICTESPYWRQGVAKGLWSMAGGAQISRHRGPIFTRSEIPAFPSDPVEDSTEFYSMVEKYSDTDWQHWDSEAIQFPTRAWKNVDRYVGALWLAMRTAVSKQGTTLTLVDGKGLLDLGNGLLVEVSSSRRRLRQPAPLRALLWVGNPPGSAREAKKWRLHFPEVAGSISWQSPFMLELRDANCRFLLSPLESPFHMLRTRGEVRKIR